MSNESKLTTLVLDEPTHAEMETKAVEAVFNGTEWLTAHKGENGRHLEAKNTHVATSGWKEDKVFAIERDGQT